MPHLYFVPDTATARVPVLRLALAALAQSASAQLRCAQTITLRADGDGPMCEKTIEKVAFVKGEAEADRDVDAKTARITWDSTRTNLDAVLEPIPHAVCNNARSLFPRTNLTCPTTPSPA